MKTSTVLRVKCKAATVEAMVVVVMVVATRVEVATKAIGTIHREATVARVGTKAAEAMEAVTTNTEAAMEERLKEATHPKGWKREALDLHKGAQVKTQCLLETSETQIKQLFQPCSETTVSSLFVSESLWTTKLEGLKELPL